jgi:hypothetical protein
VALPAIWFSGMGYMWLIEHGLKFDTQAKPQTIAQHLIILVALLPMIPVMVCAICLAGIPWMFVMARTLSWEDIEYFTKQKGQRLPLLSDWLDWLWLRMVRRRRPDSPTNGLSR